MTGHKEWEHKYSIKKQWYLFYFVVLIIPMLVMMFAYRFSYAQLADAVYDRQMDYLTHVRSLMDSEARNMKSTMLSFAIDPQIREAASVKDPVEEKKMSLYRDLITDIKYASVNQNLVDRYVLYFPESDYLIDRDSADPRRLISWKDYSGAISETECAAIVAHAQTGELSLLTNANGDLILFSKVLIYRTTKPLYIAAVLSTNELARQIGSGIATEEAVIALESLDNSYTLSSNKARYSAYQSDRNEWFHVEIESEALPLRYIYAIPTDVVEEKLTTYQYVIYAFLGASLLLGGIAIWLMVQRQYAPIERLMQYFSSDKGNLENEYQNISDYLLQVQERNDHHFMIDMLLGNVPESHAFPFTQLLLLAPIDGDDMLNVDEVSASHALSDARLINVYGQIALIFQHRQYSEHQIVQLANALTGDKQIYMIYTLNEGQSLHQSFAEAADMLSALRFFHAPNQTVYHARTASQEQTLQIMSGSFEENFRSAIFTRNEEKAWRLMQDALTNMQDKCHSGNLLRGSLYAISILFMRLEAALRAQNPAIPDGVSGAVVRSYRYSNMDQLVAGIRQAIHDMIAIMEIQGNRKNNSLFEQVNDYIRQNYSNPNLNIDTIADHFNFSAVYLRQIYKQNAGISISDAILGLRIEAAKQALANPGSKVNDVARQVGFLETGTFIRSFKKKEGVTPGAYKDQHPFAPVSKPETEEDQEK